MRRWLFLGVMVTVLPLGCFGTDSGDADEGAGAQGGAGARGGAGGSGGQGADAGAPATGGTGTGGADDAPPACEQSGDMPFWWAMPLAKESAGILGMALGSNDAIFLTGEYSSRLTLGAGQPNETVLESLLGSRDAFVAKLEPDGSLAWAKHAGGSADDAGHDVQVASDGSLRVVGVFEGTGLFGEGEPGETQLQAEGSRDLFVIELADDGTLEWAKRAGAIDAGGGSVGSALARLAGDDSLRVLGWFSGTVSFGPGEANETELVSVLPAGDMFLASYSADGELEWARRIEGSQLSGGASIAGRGIDLRVDADGTALVVATGSITFAPGEPEETALGGVSVGQYDASGALLGAASAGGGGRLAAAALDADGNVHVGGLFTDSITFGSGQTNETTLEAPAFVDGAEMFLAKVAPDGEVEWAKQASLGQKASLNGLGIAADGTLRLLAQYFSQAELGPGELGAVKLTDGSCLIANYDTDGTVISAKDVSRWHSAMNLPPAPPFVRTLAVSASDGSLRVVGYVGTTDPITLGEGEPGETVIDGVSSWIAAYATCP